MMKLVGYGMVWYVMVTLFIHGIFFQVHLHSSIEN